MRRSFSTMPGSSSIVAKASRSPIQPDNGSFATTVAVRGPSRSKAISPTIIPGCDSATVSCPSTPLCVTSARPDPMSKKETASSPCCMSTWPGAAVSGCSCAASGTRASVGQPANTSSAASSSAWTLVRPDTSRGYGVAVTTSKEYAVSRVTAREADPGSRCRTISPWLLGWHRGRGSCGRFDSEGEPVEPSRCVHGEEPGLRAGHHEGVRQLPRQERDRPGSRGMRFTTHLHTQFAVEHEEGLLFCQRPVQRTAITSLTLVFQDVQASGCVLPAAADAYQRAHES